MNPSTDTITDDAADQQEAASASRIGIELPEVYDGISVWVEPDGTYTNRWATAVDRYPEGSNDRAIVQARADAAQGWIDQQATNPSPSVQMIRASEEMRRTLIEETTP